MKRVILLSVLLLAEIAFFTSISGATFSSSADIVAYARSYFADIIAQSAPILILGFGMTLILMTAGIDLSVASAVALAACVMSTFEGGPRFWWTAVPAGLATALAAGALNGLLIARFDVPPIIATLGTMIFYRGLCFVIMGDLENAPFLEAPGYESLGQFSGAILLAGVVFVLGGLLFANSAWSREILMLGGNRVAARYAGVPVGKRTFQVYLLMGFLAFLAALTFTARNGSVSASSLSGFELHVIVAVVLGGTKVQGGSGTLLGSVFGVFFIAVLDEGLRGAAVWGGQNLPFKISHLEYVLLGALLLAGAVLNAAIQRRSARN